MAFCGNCGTPLGNGTRFCPNCGHPVQQQQYAPQYQQPQQQRAYQTQQQQQYQQSQRFQRSDDPLPIKPNTHMTMAILVTVIFCMPLGLIAVNYANKVNSFYYTGLYAEAEKASNDAKKWSVIGIISSIVVLLVYFIIFMAATNL